jgi:outer membrane protein assembly factor BamB
VKLALGGRRAGVSLRVLSAGCAFALLIGPASYARDVDRVQSFVVGPSRGLANCEWLDAGNTSRAQMSFPRAPEVSFRIRVPGGIGQAPASDDAGNLIVVHGEPRVSKLDDQGRTLWTERIGSEAMSAPVLISDGSILLLTHDGEALLLAPSGKLLHKSVLPLAEPLHRTFAIPTTNAGALVASGTDIVELDSLAEVRRQTHVRANVSAIAEWHSDLIAISENGAVSLAHATGDFEIIGNLGGAVPEGGAVQGDKLFAVVDARKLVALDLSTGTVVTLASDAASPLSGPPVLFADQSSVVVADGNFLAFHAKTGVETLRVSSAEAGRAFDPATRALRPAQLIGDARGAVAGARSGSDAFMLQPDGKALRFDNTTCLDPFRPTPTLHGVVFACRSGQLFGVSDKAP